MAAGTRDSLCCLVHTRNGGYSPVRGQTEGTREGTFAFPVSTAERKGQTEVSVKQKLFTHHRAHDETRAPHDQVNLCRVRWVKATTANKQTNKKIPNNQEKSSKSRHSRLIDGVGRINCECSVRQGGKCYARGF